MEVVENAPWGCYESHDGVHVAPMMDMVDHELNENCVCIPSVEHLVANDSGDAYLYTHHSLDGREASE